jgi:hypothetical protein
MTAGKIYLLVLCATVLALSGCQKQVEKPAKYYSLTLDQMFLKVAEQAPEFGGMFIDQDGVLNVYLTDVSRLGTAKDAMVKTFGSEVIPTAGMKALPADYRFLDLYQWHVAHAAESLAEPGVHSVDIQEVNNRLRIGVEHQTAKNQVLAMLMTLGIPPAAVEFFMAPPMQFRLENLTDTLRPFMGGLQSSSNQTSCTVGFLATRNGVAGYVTNSHCQDVQGSFSGTQWHQAVVGDGMQNKVGKETVDPDYFFGGDCQGGLQCRFSDAAFIAREGAEGLAPPTGEFDAIALPVDYASGGKAFGTFVRLRHKEPHALCGQHVTNVGSTSGSQTGFVTETCVNKASSVGNFGFICQNVVDITSMGGDSGSPIFTWSSATLPQGAKPTATLFGILWGGSGGESAYSSINLIEQELGALRIHRGEGGDNSAPEIEIISPADNAQVGMGGLAIETYQAAASDWEDGEGCCTVTWSSNVDGPLAGGKQIDHAFMTPGTRVITATATDSDGLFDTDTITVETSNSPPHMTIQAPTIGQTFNMSAPVQMKGKGWDVNEPFQQLPCNALTWSSSHPADSGWQPSNCIVSYTFTVPGSRTITLAGTDSGGLQDTDTVTINVITAMPNSPPDVSISVPAVAEIHPHNVALNLTGTVVDFDGGTTVLYEWVVQPVGSTQLFGGVTEISIGNGSANSGQVVTTAWIPNTAVIGNPGGAPVRILLRGTDPDGTSTAERETTVMFPPS